MLRKVIHPLSTWQAKHQGKSANAPAVTSEQTLRGMRVLVVADNDINLEVTTHILEREGAQVLLASNGLEAFERIQTEPRCIDVVLMDVQMPVLDGCAATRRIRRELNMPDLPIIALTSVALSDERQRATAAGMNDYLVRPLSPRVLVSSILRHASPADPQLTGDHSMSNETSTPDRIWWPAIEGIDSTDVEARLSGDFTMFLSMLKRHIDEFSDIAIPATPEDCVLSNQVGRMHKLKGSAGMLGARAIQQLAGDAEVACAAGDIVRAARIATHLVEQLAKLSENTTLISKALPTQPALRELPNDGELDPHDLADLIQLLRRQNLSAMARFKFLAPQIRSMLGTHAYSGVRDHIDSLRFEQAARLLEQSPL